MTFDISRLITSDVLPDNTELAHYGVLGMKWGVRKDRRGRIKPRATLSRRDQKDRLEIEPESKNPRQEEAYNNTYRKAAGRIRSETRKLNKLPKYQGQDFRRDSVLRREYYNDYSQMVTRQLNAASAKKGRIGKSFELHFEMDISKSPWPEVTIQKRDTPAGRRTQWESRKISVADRRKDDSGRLEDYHEASALLHADEKFESVKMELVFDSMGYIIDIKESEELLDFFEHSIDSLDALIHSIADMPMNELSHYGVLGMKWGVRKDRRTGKVYITKEAKARAKRNNTPLPKGKVVPKPKPKAASKPKPKEQPKKELSPDEKAKRDRADAVQKRRSLTNEDMRERINRMKLEKEFQDVTAKDLSPGKKIVKDILTEVGKRAATDALTKIATGTVLYGTKYAIDKKFDAKGFGNYIAPGLSQKKKPN